jgi:carbonic anhydrase
MSHHDVVRSILLMLLAPLVACAEAWGYDVGNGPDRWADLDPAYAMARSGRRQSPVDISPPTGTGGESVVFSYGRGDLVIRRESLMLSCDVVGGAAVRTGDEVRRLTGFHFHSPGEHTIGGQPADIEMHLLHEGDDDRLTVVAVLIDGGRPPSFIGDIVSLASVHADDGSVLDDVDLTRLLPADPSSQWRYEGSRTFPPCTEDVDWVVLQNRLAVSNGQLEALRSTYVGNVRPTQPLNGRTIVST